MFGYAKGRIGENSVFVSIIALRAVPKNRRRFPAELYAWAAALHTKSPAAYM